jgi:HSP20 family molecular chaperone IbpA
MAPQADIDFENGMLTIHGRLDHTAPDGMTLVSNEYGVGDFYRTFQVSEKIDSAKITAEFTDGVLRLHMPKVDQAKPRKIAVRAN